MSAIQTLIATIIFVLLASCGGEQTGSTDIAETVAGDNAADRAAALITADSMRGHIIELSSDRYEGRGPGSAGDRLTRQYLIEQMQAIGLQPGAANGKWEQSFNLIGVTAEQPASWNFQAGKDALTLKQWDEFIVGSGVQAERAEVADAEIVFVGYGIQAPEYEWDDFKGVDLTGKIALIMNNDPDWDADLFAGETRLYYGRWGYKYESVARQGAVGAIIIHTAPSAGYLFQVVQTSWTGEQFELPAGDEPRSQIEAWLTEDAARQLVSLGGHDLDALREAAENRDFQPVPLGVTTSLGMNVSLTSVQTANVLGLIPGNDPDLQDEVVIYTAHHDHLGIGTPNAAGDALYNGAMDNASGVAQVLAIARAIKSLPQPARRTMLFAFVAAEEQGRLGSMYYAANPTFPPGKIAANINIDGGNIWGHTHDVTFIGLGKSTIDDIVKSIAESQKRVVKPDQFADRGYYYRSDQFSFAKIGVPALYLKTGTDFVDRPAGWGKEQQDHHDNANYHQPSDEYDDSWNFDGMIDDARLAFWTGLSIGLADEMPRWNPGDEFEAARLEALDSVSQ